MARNSKRMSKQRRKQVPLRGGKITLLAIVFLLLIVVLMGLLGNTGHVTTQKMEIQNAADSLAFSSSLWLARGMNTVTASNHLIGEATALSVLHESLGGPELRLDLRKSTLENRKLDASIRALRTTSPIGRVPNPYVPPFLTSIDKRLVDFVTKQTSPPGNGQLTEFATIYDARMALKRGVAGWLTAKSIANLAFLVPPPIGYLPAIAAYATHIAGSVNVALYGKEWLLLRVLAVYAKAAAPVHKKVVDGQVVPSLCKFSGEVAGVELAADGQAEGGKADDESGFAPKAAVDSSDSISQRLRVDGIVFPSEELELPVEFEPKPDGSGMPAGWKTGAGQLAWGADRAKSLPSLSSARDKMGRRLRKAVSKMRARSNDLDDSVEELQEISAALEKRAEGVSPEMIPAFDREIRKVDQLIVSTVRERDELNAKARQVEAEQLTLEASLAGLQGGQSQNLSLEHIPAQMNPEQERVTQWVRATMPNLDQMRAPILGLMKQHLKKSHAAEHFEKWTNRYALIAAWKFRSGQRLKRTGTASASWSRQRDPLGMLVMQDSYRESEPRKGLEVWTGSSSEAQQEAESLFTVLGIAHRGFEPLFSSTVFPAPQQNGITTVGLGILYNASPQSSPSGGQTQPLLGWDTLNWDTGAASLPEWGAPASQSATRWPWELFDAVDSESLVKLNWQAKLMPVTKSRLEQLASDGELEEGPRAAIELAIDHSGLLTH